MNIYAVIIVSALLIDHVLSFIADCLNLKHLSGELPAEFEGVYDADQYQKSQAYTRMNTKFGFIISTFNLAVTLTFWFAGGFNWLDMLVRSWNLPFIWTGLCYVGILMGFRFLLGLPFSIYGTFVIEEKFGFNKTTPKTFILDIIKGLALSLVICGPVFAAVLALFKYAGPPAWLYCWIVTTVFTLILQYIAPTWIMPLFNKFEPLEEDELKDKILSYADKVNYSLAGIFVMDGSRRSTKSNAFFTGFGRHKRIALFDTLIEKHSADELLTILAHEIGHYKKKHVLIGMGISILHMGIVFYLLSLFLSQEALFDAFLMDHNDYLPIYAGFLFFGMLYSPVEMLLSIAMSIVSRRHEYQADRFAVKTTNLAEAFISALKKLSVHNLSNLRPHPFYVFLNYSHPPVLQRIRAIRESAETAEMK
ncbi:M48 family metallopeptidase [bacterium]|nr:M48 family metallopeptidase [bacterium]